MNDAASCALCPRDCRVSRVDGDLGFCHAPKEMMVARAALHFWEEPPISGSAGSGTIFFSFCSLLCTYCQNRAISRSAAGKRVSIEDVANMMLDLQSRGAMNINLVTPTHYSNSVRSAILQARARGLALPIVWNTSGYETVQNIDANTGFVDVYLTDFKYLDSELSRELSKAHDYPTVAIAALDEMVASLPTLEFDSFKGEERLTEGVVVRHLLLPGHLDASKDVVRFLHERYGDKIMMSLMSQYTPTIKTDADAGDERAAAFLNEHPEFGRTVTEEEYEQLLDFADAIGVEDYWWQNGDVAQESFIPAFDS